MSSDNIDHLSQLPEEMLDLIFYFCSETNDRNDEHVYIKYKYYPDHRLYQEYRGDMRNGVPHGNGIMYQGRSVYAEIKNKYLENGFQTPWIFLPLLEVFPKFEPKLTLITY